MRKETYETERDGQIAFFDNFRIPWRENDEVLANNTDGVWNGNLFEFKLNIDNLNKVLFQAIKYCSRLRIKGESVPANILLVSLDTATLYLYHTQDYFEEIHKVYAGAASQNNSGFAAKPYVKKYDYTDMVDAFEIQKILKEDNHVAVRMDENCIVGWAERYYRENPKASKGDFLGDDTGKVRIVGEIRDPRSFKGLILPYNGKTNEKFKYLMDKLNDRLKKKDLGAFYTPMPYAEKACELVEMAIRRVPEGNDYIILDRCCGTGNLEQAILDVLGEEVASHIVCSTYEYYEYKVLCERLGDKVRCIIPPTEAQVEYGGGCVLNADAMSEEYINNPIIRQYVNDPKCAVILFENPPYSDTSAATFTNEKGGTEKVKTGRKKSFVAQQYIADITNRNETRNSSQELSNLFIWSGFRYYIRQSTDSYIVFSPVKYFKNIHLISRKALGGFLFNREHFHASASAISVMFWSEEETDEDVWNLPAYDIVDENAKYIGKDICIRKVYAPISILAKNTKEASDVETNVVCNSDGTPEQYAKKTGRIPVYNDDIIGYMYTNAFPVNAINRMLVRCNWKPGLMKSQGYHLRRDGYLNILPLWCTKMFPQDEWYEKEVYFTTSDGGDAYTHDQQFLKSCLIYTCLSNQNKCLTFDGPDGRHYQNELCFDNSATLRHTPPTQDDLDALPLALKDLNRYAMGTDTALDEDEKELLRIWNNILAGARRTKTYNPAFTYGVYQITKELNTSWKNEKNQVIYDHPELNGDLTTLRTKLKEYYKTHITGKMFEYQLLK